MDSGESDHGPDAPEPSSGSARVINAALHGVIRVDTVREVGEAIEDAFADTDRYSAAWLGSVDRTTGEVTAQERSEGGSTVAVGDRVDRIDTEVIAEAVQTGDPRVAPGRSGQSQVGVFPVRCGDAFDGFLAVHTDGDGFESEDRDALAGLASSIADRVDAIAERDRLVQQTERLEAFTRTVSHDLRNPLEVLDHSIELVAETENIDHLDRCRDAADRMETLVEDLRVLAQQGDLVDERRELAIPSLVADCWRTVETADASLSVEADVRVRADRERLQQLFENLFRNAVEHGATGGRTSSVDAADRRSTTTSRDREATTEHDQGDDATPCDGPMTITVGATSDSLYVADDGCGIPVEEREAVFEQGFSTAGNGSGFGLAIVEEIANAHGWTVRVDDSESGGARFDIQGVEFA